MMDINVLRLYHYRLGLSTSDNRDIVSREWLSQRSCVLEDDFDEEYDDWKQSIQTQSLIRELLFYRKLCVSSCDGL